MVSGHIIFFTTHLFSGISQKWDAGGCNGAPFLLPTLLNRAVPTIQQCADVLQISLNALYGHVSFAQLALDSVQAWIATIESVVGIVIEGVFVAMLIQRFFGR